ncbi:hypothetical protein IWQ60_012337, partial [Tieghemiomyces parasiticus]
SDTTSYVVAYYPDWKAGSYPPSVVPYTQLTHLNYAFAILNEDTTLTIENPSTLHEISRMAHDQHTQVLIAVGGWTGSKYFSPIAANPVKRQQAISHMVEFVAKFNLDGIDLDWEFPGRVGEDCNVVDFTNDTPNLLILLQELRTALDAKFPEPSSRKLITMAVRVQPFEVDEKPLTDVSAYASLLDYISVMAYDINGGWSDHTGPNAPFVADPSDPNPNLSYTQAINDWTAAGFPAHQIVAGVPFYGRSVHTEQPMDGRQLVVSQTKVNVPGDSDDGMWASPRCSHQPAVYSTVWKYRNLRSQGILAADGSVVDPQWKGYWDEKSQTPWLYNAAQKTFVSYDNVRSISNKANYAREQGLRGIMGYDLSQDNGELLTSISEARWSLSGSSSPGPASVVSVVPESMPLVDEVGEPEADLVPTTEEETRIVESLGSFRRWFKSVIDKYF